MTFNPINWLNRLPDPAARALRTFVQVLAAEIVATIIQHGTVLLDLSQWVETVDGGIVAALAALLSLGWNAAEDYGPVAPVAKPRR